MNSSADTGPPPSEEEDCAVRATGFYGGFVLAGTPNAVVALDIDDPAEPTVEASVPVEQAVEAMAHGDGFLVASLGSGGLLLLDLTDLSAVDISTWHPGFGTVQGVAAEGLTAWTVTSTDDTYGAITALDLAQPSDPEVLATHWLDTDARDVAIDGSLLFVALGTDGLAVYDVTDPLTPTEVGNLQLDTTTQRVTADGDTVWLATSAGLMAIDVTDPGAPAELASIEIDGGAQAVALSDGVAYVATEQGLGTWNVSDPAAPLALGSWTSPGAGLDVALSGEMLALADGCEGLVLLSVDDPANPIAQGTWTP